MKPAKKLPATCGTAARKGRLVSCVLALSLMLPLLSHAQGVRYTDAYGRITPTTTKALQDPTGGIIGSLGKVICESIPNTVYKDDRCQCKSGTWDDAKFACVDANGNEVNPNPSDPTTTQEQCEQGKDKGWKWDSEKGKCVDSSGNEVKPNQSNPTTPQEHCEQGKDKGWKWDSEKGKCVDANGNEVVECDNAEGGVGDEIRKSVDNHTEMASVTPVLNDIFKANQECFVGVGNVFDLSPTIPSLLDLINAALDAVKMYAKRGICKAINKITTYINAPIAQAIQKVIRNSNSAVANMSSSLNGDLLKSLINGTKGSSYHEKEPDGYIYVETNPFGLAPQNIETNEEEMARAVAETQRKVNEIQGKKATKQAELLSAESALDAAERSLQLCQTRAAVSAGLAVGTAGGSGSDCSAEQNAVAEAEENVNTIAAELADLENQMTAAINIQLPEITTTPIQNAFMTADGFAKGCDGRVVNKNGQLMCLTDTSAPPKAYKKPTVQVVTKASTKQTEPGQGSNSQEQTKSGVSGFVRSLGDLLK